jgi:hypothetical protein
MKLTIICFLPLPSIVLIHRLTASSKNWHHVKIHYIEEQFNHTLSHWNHHQGKREPHVIQQRLFIICSQSKVPGYKRNCGMKAPSKVGGHSLVFQWKHTFLKTLIKPPSQCFSKPRNRTGWKTYRDRELRSKALLTSATSALSFPSRL